MNAALDDLLLPASPLPAPPARRERILQIAPVPQRRRRPKLLYALVAVLGALGIVVFDGGCRRARRRRHHARHGGSAGHRARCDHPGRARRGRAADR